MVHTVTSSDIPVGADEFDQIWQAPADTFFQYIPKVVGRYDYVCTPHVYFGMIGSFDVVSSVTALSEVELPQIQLYPNPSHNEINITGFTEDVSFVILSVTGSIVKEGMSHDYSIDIADLPRGSYLLQLHNETGNSISFQKN